VEKFNIQEDVTLTAERAYDAYMKFKVHINEISEYTKWADLKRDEVESWIIVVIVTMDSMSQLRIQKLDKVGNRVLH